MAAPWYPCLLLLPPGTHPPLQILSGGHKPPNCISSKHTKLDSFTNLGFGPCWTIFAPSLMFCLAFLESGLKIANSVWQRPQLIQKIPPVALSCTRSRARSQPSINVSGIYISMFFISGDQSGFSQATPTLFNTRPFPSTVNSCSKWFLAAESNAGNAWELTGTAPSLAADYEFPAAALVIGGICRRSQPAQDPGSALSCKTPFVATCCWNFYSLARFSYITKKHVFESRLSAWQTQGPT